MNKPASSEMKVGKVTTTLHDQHRPNAEQVFLMQQQSVGWFTAPHDWNRLLSIFSLSASGFVSCVGCGCEANPAGWLWTFVCQLLFPCP